MPGDEVDIEVWAYNQSGISTGTSRISSANLVAALVSAFVPSGSGTDLYTQTSSVFTGVSTYLTGGGSSGTTTPFAFLNYIVFDNNFTRLASGHQRVSSTLNAKHLLTLSNINITQKGYVYVWVSNESNENKNTYFDDLKVTHTKGSILQEDHYYPFGMSIASLSNNSLLLKPNKFKYNGKELNEEFDLDWYDYGARNYDAQLGRFIQVDPAVDNYQSWTPYHYVMNNPIIFIDPTGMFTEIFDENGNKIGEDENGNDGNVSIVSNSDGKKISKRLKKEGEGALVTESDLVLGVRTNKKVLEESLDVLDRTRKVTDKDDEGGLHEESSFVMKDGEVIHGPSGDKQRVVQTKIGPFVEAKTSVPKLPKGASDNDVYALIHSHPTTVLTSDTFKFPQSARKPTGSDGDESAFKRFTQNIIVGRIGKGSESNIIGAVFYNDKAEIQRVITESAIKNILK